MNGRLRNADLGWMALRASLLQSTWNYERQQGIGWAWALEPALARLYPDAEVRRERLAEHTAYFNTQPTLASVALGAVAALEERRARDGTPDADAMGRVKGVLESSDTDEIKAKTDALQSAFHKVSEQIYQQAADQQQAASGDGAQANGAGAEEEVVDAEVVDDERA